MLVSVVEKRFFFGPSAKRSRSELQPRRNEFLFLSWVTHLDRKRNCFWFQNPVRRLFLTSNSGVMRRDAGSHGKCGIELSIAKIWAALRSFLTNPRHWSKQEPLVTI